MAQDKESSQSDPKAQLAASRKDEFQREHRSVAFSAGLIAAGTLSSRILGLVRDVLLMTFFSRFVTDAWIVAFRLPNLFRRLLGEGSLAVSFIPVFVEKLSEDEKTCGSGAQELSNAVFTLLLIILTALTVLGTVWIDQLLALLVSGDNYMSVPGKFELTVQMGRIMFAFIFLMSTYAYFMSILNSLKKFALPAFAPALLNLCIIISTLLPQKWARFPGELVTWGVILGGVCQVSLLVVPLIRKGFFPRLTFKVGAPGVGSVLRNLGPSMIGNGILQFSALLNVYFASQLPQGSHSWIYAADRLLELPLSLFAVSLGSALLPTLSRYWSQGDKEAMGESASHYMRLIFFISLPAAVGLYLLAEPLVDVLFRRGKFDADDVIHTAEVVRVYAFALLTASVLRILTTSFYATKRTWVPAVSSLAALLVHYFMAQVLIKKFGLMGLPLSTVISACVNMSILFILYRWMIGPLFFGQLLAGLAKFSVAATVMGFFLVGFQSLWPFADFEAFLSRLLILGIMIAGSVAAYFGASYLMKIKEYIITLETYSEKVRSVASRFLGKL